MHGDWVIRSPSGTVAEGPDVDDKRHGQWVWRYASGGTETVTYVNGFRLVKD